MPKIAQVPVTDVLWLRAALTDALAGKHTLVPLAADQQPLPAEALITADPRAAVLLPTSGSTGTPKIVQLSAAALLANAHATLDALAGPGQWLIALPLTAISGLAQLVRSEIAGAHPVFSAGNAQAIIAQAQTMQAATRYLAVVPTQLTDLLALAACDKLAAETLKTFAAVLVGGAPVPLQLQQQAWEAGINLVCTYGSTETAGGCVYDGVEIGDTKVRIRNGQVQIAGSNLALGYLADPQLTAQKFITEADTRWYVTGDSGQLLGGVLEITGRLDRVFISGGVNVSLARIEQVAAQNSQLAAQNPQLCAQEPQLAASANSWAAVAVTDSRWGQRAVLWHAGNNPLTEAQAQQQIAQIRSQLGVAAAPIAIFHLPHLPQLANGKIDYPRLEALSTQQLAKQQETQEQ